MLEILVILGVLLAVRKKGGSRRRRYNLRSVRFSFTTADMVSLGAGIALSSAVFGDPAGRPYRMVTVMGTWTMENMDILDGPVLCGFAHGDYTVTEIKECIESSGSINVGDKVAQEQSNRLVRIVGTFGGGGSGGGDIVLNDGKPIKTRLNWLLPIGKTFNVFVYNDGTSALAAEAKFVKFNGTAWVKDL